MDQNPAPTETARIRWGGAVYTARPISQLPDGRWLMEMLAHGPRFTIGTEVYIEPGEIVAMGGAAPKSDSPPFDLEAAMAAERRTLPPLSELLKKGVEVKHDAPGKIVTKGG